MQMLNIFLSPSSFGTEDEQDALSLPVTLISKKPWVVLSCPTCSDKEFPEMRLTHPPNQWGVWKWLTEDRYNWLCRENTVCGGLCYVFIPLHFHQRLKEDQQDMPDDEV